MYRQETTTCDNVCITCDKAVRFCLTNNSALIAYSGLHDKRTCPGRNLSPAVRFFCEVRTGSEGMHMRTRKGYVGEQIMVCLQSTLKSWVEMQAAQEEMALSTWIRGLIAREAKRDLQRSREVQGNGSLRAIADD
jgi:hypothetical protein